MREDKRQEKDGKKEEGIKRRGEKYRKEIKVRK